MAKKTKRMTEEEENVLEGLISNNSTKEAIYSIPFRHLGLQKITNGVKSGYLVEIRGESQGGKSFLLYELMAECEKLKGFNLLFDLEHALEDSYKKSVGITDKRTQVSSTFVIEKMVPLAIKFVEKIREKHKTCPIVIGVDSWVRIKPASVQEAVENGVEREFGNTDAMRNNNVIFDQLAPLLNILSEQNVVFVILNQMRFNPLIMFGDKNTSRGNNILQYECHLRLTGKLRGQIKVSTPSLTGKKDVVVGSRTEWVTTKNRGVKPFQSVTTTLRYTTGINKYSGLEELLVNDGTIVAALKSEPKVKKEKDNSSLTDKELRKLAAKKQIAASKKVDVADYRFKMNIEENEVWFDTIQDLIQAHPEALNPLITGMYSVSEEAEFEEEIGSDNEE